MGSHPLQGKASGVELDLVHLTLHLLTNYLHCYELPTLLRTTYPRMVCSPRSIILRQAPGHLRQPGTGPVPVRTLYLSLNPFCKILMQI
jgi:hypothetical protein